jgi:hypothetical protein
MKCCIMLSLDFTFCLRHMFEIFKFEFVVWLDLNSKEKIKRKRIRNLVAQLPPSLSHSAH